MINILIERTKIKNKKREGAGGGERMWFKRGALLYSYKIKKSWYEPKNDVVILTFSGNITDS